MTSKIVTFKLKLDKNIREMLKEFCKTRGLAIKGFIEKAILDAIEKERLKEELAEDMEAIGEYERGKRKVIRDEKSVKKCLGL